MEENTMEKLICPSCGSPEVGQLGYPEYKCAYCGTRFVPAQAPTGFVDVVLVKSPAGKNQIDVIIALRRITKLGLSEAKQAVENLPSVIKQNVTIAEGERIKATLEKAGATATLKPA
jgi:large subunit ribosomal protein L7/L12